VGNWLEGKKKERRRKKEGKEEAGPSPIRASRVCAQDDNERQSLKEAKG